MGHKCQLYYRGSAVYPVSSIDNLTQSAESSVPVQVPILDSQGKIEMAYIPDGIGGGIWTPIVDLGDAATVSVSAGGAYSLTVAASTTRTITASVTAGKCGKDAYIRIILGSGASITALAPLQLNGTLTANATNNCYVRFFDQTAVLTKKDNLT